MELTGCSRIRRRAESQVQTPSRRLLDLRSREKRSERYHVELMMDFGQGRLFSVSNDVSKLVSGYLTRIGKITILLGDLAIVLRVCEDDAPRHAIVLSIMDLCSPIDASVVRQRDLAFEFDPCIFQHFEICSCSTASQSSALLFQSKRDSIPDVDIFGSHIPTSTHSMESWDPIRVATRGIFF